MKTLVRGRFPMPPGQGLGRSPVGIHGAPVSFTAGATGLPPSQSVVLNASALQSGYRAAYWIDEIRMQAVSAPVTIDALAPGLFMGLGTRFQFRTGNHNFSKTGVPLWLYTPLYNNSVLGINSLSGQSTYTGDMTRICVEARWRLPQPLWMAPGDGIQCTVDRDSTGAGNNIDVDVLYAGRACAPAEANPASQAVPWVTYYVHDMSNQLYSHTNQEFRNPFTVPWTIHRLTARTNNLHLAYDDGNLSEGPALMLPAFDAGGVQAAYMTMRIDDSMGYKIVGGGGANGAAGGSGSGFVAVGAIFDSSKLAWTFSRALEGREQLNMQFQQQPLGTGFVNDRLMIGALGYREEGV